MTCRQRSTGCATRPGTASAFSVPAGAATGIRFSGRPSRCARDVLDDFCTREHAYQAYGVVLNEALEIDPAATEARRAEMAKKVA